VLGAPPLIAASLIIAAMLLLWLASKFLRFAQIGLGALAVFYLVRFALAGGVATPAPVQASNQIAPSAGMSTSTQAEASPTAVLPSSSSPGSTSLAGSTDAHIDSTGVTIHIPFGGLQSVQTLLQNNQTDIQHALAPVTGTPTAVSGGEGQKVPQASN